VLLADVLKRDELLVEAVDLAAWPFTALARPSVREKPELDLSPPNFSFLRGGDLKALRRALGLRVYVEVTSVGRAQH
jgi:hypothetical protein